LLSANAKIKKILNSHFVGLTQIGAHIDMDPNLEKKKFKLSFEINDQTNIEKLKQALTEFDYNKVSKIFEGDLDVQ
jgi:sensor domain CHASE-containing protein